MDERICQGYRVIDSIRYGGAEVVLAYNPNATATPYVTWRAYAASNFQSFDHGNYFPSEQAARVDFYERASKMWSYAPEKAVQPQQPKDQIKKKSSHER